MNEVQYSSEVSVHPNMVLSSSQLITAVNIPQFSSLYLMVILDSSHPGC